MEKNLYERLAKQTEDMYLQLAHAQRKHCHVQLQQMMDETEDTVRKAKEVYSEQCEGRLLREQLRKITTLEEEFKSFREEDVYKFRILIRGCGNAGKSTLVNALLGLSSEQGSKMDKKPMTFTIDTFTDELAADEAVVKTVDVSGKIWSKKMSRQQAEQVTGEERTAFEASKKKCQKLIEERTRQVYAQEEQADIEKEVYENELLRTYIREVKWGVGENAFLKDCCLIDTPGLSQELRFTNILDDVKGYEADGIIWVVSTKGLQKGNVRDEYQHEMQLFQDIYANKKAIAVINVFDTPLEEYDVDSDEWRKFQKMGRKLFGEGFGDVICVNVRKAYEGILEGNARKIIQSNIGELRSKINQYFIEKNSDEYLDRQLGNIALFEKSLQEMCHENVRILQEMQEKYDGITGIIKSAAAGARNRYFEERGRIEEQFRAIYHNNLKANAAFVERMDDVSEEEWQHFLKTKIMGGSDLPKSLARLQNKAMEEAAREFENLQKSCVVSDYNTSKYAFRNFQSRHGNYQLMVKNLEKTVQGVTKDWGSIDIGVIGDWMDGLLETIVGSELGVRRKISNFLTRLMRTPMERAGKAVDAIVKNIGAEYSINPVLDEYSEFCEKLRDDSMAELCGSSQLAEEICRKLAEQKTVPQKKTIEQADVWDILMGGTANEV